MTFKSHKISVVIPAYKVKDHLLKVIDSIGPEVSYIYVVDDCCPQESGAWAQKQCNDKRVRYIHNEFNLGVGGAVINGYYAAVREGADVVVKIDGDGQMNSELIPQFVNPIIKGDADYTKGNRFYDLSSLEGMPPIRVFGNAILSFMTKFSAGYWNLFDPTNGFTAIHKNIILNLPLEKISKRYFFETDMLFRLYILRAKVKDIPMKSLYGNEISNLKIKKIFLEFLLMHIKNFCKRIFYCYYLRDMSIASIELPVGLFLFLFGVIYGLWNWIEAFSTGAVTPAGTIMLSALPTLVGLQLLLGFFAYDINSEPTEAISSLLEEADHKLK